MNVYEKFKNAENAENVHSSQRYIYIYIYILHTKEKFNLAVTKLQIFNENPYFSQ